VADLHQVLPLDLTPHFTPCNQGGEPALETPQKTIAEMIFWALGCTTIFIAWRYPSMVALQRRRGTSGVKDGSVHLTCGLFARHGAASG
jgi:hypothetical protein